MATLSTIQQPDLRAYPCLDRLPKGCIMFPVTNDEAWPIFRAGEVVVIDSRQRDPVDGELFVIEYGQHGPAPRKCIVEAFSRIVNTVRAGGPGAPERCWYTGAYNRPRSAEQFRAWLDEGRKGGVIEGPYGQDERGAAYMRERFVGRVIGILQPEFDERRLKKLN